MTTVVPEPDLHNVWRLETPGNVGWSRSARTDAADKFFMVSADGHVVEPGDLWARRMGAEFHDRLPGVIVDPRGNRLQKTEGFRPTKLLNVPLEGHELLRNESGRTPEARISDLALDGVDAEVLFPNKGLTIWATPDALFSQAMCRAYNEWAWETFGPFNDQLVPTACVATGDLDGAIAEIQRCAALGFKGLCLPCKPVFGPPNHEDLNYNLREFEPLWDCIDDVDLPITFHVSTGRDPRTARSQGGAVINYTVHSLAPTMEPLVNICASGVAERHPNLRFGSIEAGIGWVAWMLEAMDEAYRKHHMWVRPKLELLPSEYFRRQGFASFQEDKAGLDLAREHELVDNFLWANDFPHHEGSWPYSAQAVERTMGGLDDDERAKILGLNSARIFKLPIPARYLDHADAAAVEAARSGS
ncbi:MAG: amidohydrolase [Ilumatobacteraceae bacterium]|jgi:predicted TIM-barrel fold metal-dependent hydrolase|nr:amidohydrolase [Ilumatobacteraceae bacterium]